MRIRKSSYLIVAFMFLICFSGLLIIINLCAGNILRVLFALILAAAGVVGMVWIIRIRLNNNRKRIESLQRESLANLHLRKELVILMPLKEQRETLLADFERITKNVRCPHSPSHILFFVAALLRLPKGIEGCIVEAGCFKGGSTTKFSLVAKHLDRSLVVFDSFEGLPENSEKHKRTIFGRSIKGWFDAKKYCGSLDEVKNNVERFGEISVCRFVKGWFEDTLPKFSDKVCAAYLDADLAASTKSCLKYIYPKIVPGGILVSQDGDFPLVIEVFDDDNFWQNEVGCQKPTIEGLGKSKILTIVKPSE